MRKFINWIKQSNRLYHFILGAAIGAASNSGYCAALAGTCTAGSMEVKDWLHGGRFDMIDFGMTIAGVVIGYTLRIILWGK